MWRIPAIFVADVAAIVGIYEAGCRRDPFLAVGIVVLLILFIAATVKDL